MTSSLGQKDVLGARLLYKNRSAKRLEATCSPKLDDAVDFHTCLIRMLIRPQPTDRSRPVDQI